ASRAPRGAVAPGAGAGPAGPPPGGPPPWGTGGPRPPPVARPLAGYSRYGVTFTVAAPVPGSAPTAPATVTTTGPPAGSPPGNSLPPPPAARPAAAGVTAPNQTAEARAASRMPAIPPAARPCGRTARAPNRSSWPSP